MDKTVDRSMDKTDHFHSPVAEEIPSPRSNDPPEIKDISLYGRKCQVVNDEIDRMGMGKYQWYIWSLCGFGYLIDLLWAQAFGLALGPLQQELGFPDDQTGNIATSFSAGLTAGAFTWGVLVDIVGRQWAFNLTCLISSVFGLGLGGTNSYDSFLVLTAFVGFGVGGNIPIDTTITLEFIPQNKRFLLALLSVFQPIGVVLCSAIAYGFIPNNICTPNYSEGDIALPSCRNVPEGVACCRKQDNMGWRYMLFTLGAITLGVFILRFVVFRFKESPKYLLYRGMDEKAVEVLQHIAKVNHVESHVTLETFRALDYEFSSEMGSGPVLGSGTMQKDTSIKQKLLLELERYKLLFANAKMTQLTILVWLTYIMDYWGFTVAGTYLPQILALKNGAINVSLRSTYRSYVYIFLPGTVGVLLGGMLYRVPHVGRKWTMVISSGLMGASIFIYSTVNDQASNIGLNTMEYFFQSMFNAVLYGWTPEAFPAPIRGTACGLASFWGRLFGIVSPLIAQHLYGRTNSDQSSNINAVLYLAGGVTLGCVITTALLPSAYMGKKSL